LRSRTGKEDEEESGELYNPNIMSRTPLGEPEEGKGIQDRDDAKRS